MVTRRKRFSDEYIGRIVEYNINGIILTKLVREVMVTAFKQMFNLLIPCSLLQGDSFPRKIKRGENG
jgi:hypothetical protein